ncbi:MAG TPA: hypothetical protein EYP49_09385 [Anaerolineae bacterium]|nr:hypothetical protein [Anaerolineae bacterium]
MEAIEYDYIEEADILEIFFERGEATGAVPVAEHVTLRFRREDGRPLSLILENFTYLVQAIEPGPRSFPLTREEWPPELEDSIIKMLTTPPVNQFLKVLTYQESPQAGQAIPIVYVTNSRRFEDILAPAA